MNKITTLRGGLGKRSLSNAVCVSKATPYPFDGLDDWLLGDDARVDQGSVDGAIVVRTAPEPVVNVVCSH
jgi:hypothetical protein